MSPVWTLLAAYTLVTAMVVSASPPKAAARYAEGAPPGFSGGAGEESCHACHFDFAINSTPGQLTMTGVPDRFTAGERYPLTVTLSRPGMALAGFQLAARFADGTQAGTLAAEAADEERVKVEQQGAIHYANQRRSGAKPSAAGRANWRFVWTAPQGTGRVTFHVAANAADGDEAARGDYVYTASVSSQAE